MGKSDERYKGLTPEIARGLNDKLDIDELAVNNSEKIYTWDGNTEDRFSFFSS